MHGCAFGSALGDYYGLGRVLVWSNRTGLFADLASLVSGAEKTFIDCKHVRSKNDLLMFFAL